MIRRPPRSTRTDTLLPYTTLVRSTEEQAEAALIEFMKKYVPKGKSPMCGNTICQDRRFMARGMHKLEAFFHYRNLDVSTLKELCRRRSEESSVGKEGVSTCISRGSTAQ